MNGFVFCLSGAFFNESNFFFLLYFSGRYFVNFRMFHAFHLLRKKGEKHRELLFVDDIKLRLEYAKP